MRCRIEKREGYDTKFEEKHEILHTHTNSKQKRVFQERGREEEKRFSIVTGHSHAQAQPKRKIQTKHLTIQKYQQKTLLMKTKKIVLN